MTEEEKMVKCIVCGKRSASKVCDECGKTHDSDTGDRLPPPDAK